jgi:hypothetical protein
MAAFGQDGIHSVSLAEATACLRLVPPDGELVRVGRALGVCFGDELIPAAATTP